MVCGIMVFALLAGILATGYAEEMRRSEFLRTWEMVAKVPFFHNLGATLIAEVARLLRVRDYPGGAVIVGRGEPGDCMYFVVQGEVEIAAAIRIRCGSAPVFFRRAGAAHRCAAQRDDRRRAAVYPAGARHRRFFRAVGRQPELARVIHDEATQRLAPGTPVHAALRAMIARDNAPAS